MIPHWETQCGDEWWYSDHILKAIADRNIDTFSFAIEVFGGQNFSVGILYLFLRRTQNQFPECKLYCQLDRTTEPFLNQLSVVGRLKGKLIKHPSKSEARIIEIMSDETDG
jgi:hypothetical protein